MSVAKWPMKVTLECIVALKEATWQSVFRLSFYGLHMKCPYMADN